MLVWEKKLSLALASASLMLVVNAAVIMSNHGPQSHGPNLTSNSSIAAESTSVGTPQIQKISPRSSRNLS